jgi:4-carboxymuconolactone decarboxylase
MNAAQQQQYDQGLTTRKQVMGEDFVARALAGITPFTAPIQEHITRAAWGDVWQRDGLDRKTRSLVTVAMLAALGRPHELKGHVRGALNNGASVQEIQEVLLHAAIYCGVPSAVDAFRAAAEVVEPCCAALRFAQHRAAGAAARFTRPPAACAPGRPRWRRRTCA